MTYVWVLSAASIEKTDTSAQQKRNTVNKLQTMITQQQHQQQHALPFPQCLATYFQHQTF